MMGGALIAAFLALASGGCTRTMSLGAAGTDGGDAHMTIDATPLDQAHDVTVDDASPNDTGPDAVIVVDATSNDVPVDQMIDTSTVTCTENGVTYHAGDVVPRGCPVNCICLPNGLVGECVSVGGLVCPPADGSSDSNTSLAPCVDNGITYHSGDVVLRSGCQLSCVCTDGVVGDCSGIPCPGDALIIVDPAPLATITQGDASPNIEVSIDTRGSAERAVLNAAGLMPPPLARSYPPGSPEVTLFLYYLHRVGDLSQLTSGCPGSANAIRVSSISGTSGNLRCLSNPTADTLALELTAEVLLGASDGNDPINARSCTTTGGALANSLCCTGSGNFPDTCAVGACSCSPTNVHVIDTCLCPTNSCFLPSIGCVGEPANVCTVGANQTCNDDATINSIHGTCVTGGHCQCATGFTLLASGKCS